MEVKHTPGPWRIDYGTFAVVADHPTGNDQDLNLLYYNGHLVCESIKWEANAHLIAASPDLLDFVREIAKRNPVFAKGHEKQHIKDAIALVAKAEGRS